MRILLIDDHPIVRTACHRLLAAKGGMELAEAASAAEGVHRVTDFEPDVIVLDLRLPDSTGVDTVARIVERAPGAKIIVFSMYDDPMFASRALEAGAKGYMTKNDDPNLLLDAIERVTTGEIFLTPAMAAELASIAACAAGSLDPGLSSREQQVLHLLRQGKTFGEIADELNIAYRTAAHAAAQIKSKLGLASTAALIKWAVEHPQRVER